eukprot:GEMP01025909.1.p1 GENE.GEMP01025909.1~~GEMP01025909.1.p1  ORF type:complete len:411 (+),score=79.58 GEMP01025909.1:86-1318(+)
MIVFVTFVATFVTGAGTWQVNCGILTCSNPDPAACAQETAVFNADCEAKKADAQAKAKKAQLEAVIAAAEAAAKAAGTPPVVCGGHQATVCEKCGNAAGSCNADCEWKTEICRLDPVKAKAKAAAAATAAAAKAKAGVEAAVKAATAAGSTPAGSAKTNADGSLEFNCSCEHPTCAYPGSKFANEAERIIGEAGYLQHLKCVANGNAALEAARNAQVSGTATTTPVPGCNDKANAGSPWTFKNGADNFPCSTFQQYPEWCSNYGNWEGGPVDGKTKTTAKDACCICGGGNRGGSTTNTGGGSTTSTGGGGSTTSTGGGSSSINSNSANGGSSTNLRGSAVDDGMGSGTVVLISCLSIVALSMVFVGVLIAAKKKKNSNHPSKSNTRKTQATGKSLHSTTSKAKTRTHTNE